MHNANSINITCPSCEHTFALTETLVSQLEAEVSAKFQAERKRAEAEIAKREADLTRREAERDQAIATAVAAARVTIEAEAKTKAGEATRKDLADLQAQLSEAKVKQKQAEDAELALRKEKRELEAARESWELEKARQLEEERKSIREHEAQVAGEAARQQIAERDLKIKQLSEQADLLKRKAEQGSVQLQGETLELELQSALTSYFKTDDIEEVKKGCRGGDWLQHVRPMGGSCAGTILWEAKRALNWSNDWPAKSKQDAFEQDAAIAVIVSEVLPKGVQHFGMVEGGVWVTKPEHAVALATALRCTLIETARVQAAVEGRSTKAEALWDYVTGREFKTRVENAMEAYRDLVDDHQKEKTATLRRWAKREKAHERLVASLSGIHGDIQGLGGADVPEMDEGEILSLPYTHETPKNAQ
ncbi:MAG: DUF2130 domain-containing protein [Methanoregulaceae archaeon]|nr:DUF2130 domain-containing protein [Methanoregulaceae archaeon]